jgi:hypothetical protein
MATAVSSGEGDDPYIYSPGHRRWIELGQRKKEKTRRTTWVEPEGYLGGRRKRVNPRYGSDRMRRGRDVPRA